MITVNRRSKPVLGTAARLFCLLIISSVVLLVVASPVGVPSVQAQTAGDSLYAVLYNGSSGYYVYMNNLKFMFMTLINDFGYTKDNILVCSYAYKASDSGTWYDLDGDFGNDIDFNGTKESADSAFARLKRVVTDGDIVFFYATDHGDTASSCLDATLDVYSGSDITEEDLVGYLDGLDTPDREITKIVLMNTCYAGGMIPELADLDYPLMIATAAKKCEAAHYFYNPCPDTLLSCDHDAYSFHWIAALHGGPPDNSYATLADYNNDGYVSIHEASRFARENDEFAAKNASPHETPQYWDTDCIVGDRMTLNGPLPPLPGMIAFMYPCHGAPPCRWHSWDPTHCGGGGPWPSSGRTSASTGHPQGPETTLWTSAAPALGETTYVFARVCNPGDYPLTGSQVNFYFSDPSLSLMYPQPGLNDIGTQTVPFIGPHDCVTVGPVPFVPPPGGNSFGEPHWTIMAVAEHYQSPVETGWLEDDDHVAASNRFALIAGPSEPKTVHLVAQNALAVPVKALLSIDDSALPSGWSADMNPEAGDTLLLVPGASTPVTVTLTGTLGPVLEGFVDISMTFNTTTAKTCEGCDDPICGGYIGEVGGCSIKLVVEGPVAVYTPQLRVLSTFHEITLAWEAPANLGPIEFNVYRAEEKKGDDFEKLNDAPIVGTGTLSYADRTAVPGPVYVYRLGLTEGGKEWLSGTVEASLERVLELHLSQNYPNPFNPVTTISFTLPEATHVELAIFDAKGRLVTTLVDADLPYGPKDYRWDGTDTSGNPASSGVYFCRLKVGDRTLTEKMVIVR